MNAARVCGAGLALASCGLLAACLGDTGTISVGLVTAPNSTLLDSVERIRLTLSDPREIVEATRRDGAFALTLEASANGDPAVLGVECFDAIGQLVAVGRSPRFAVGPIDARINVYVAPPLSIEAAPVRLASARYEIGSAPLRYGAIFVGGRDRAALVHGEVEIYNAYDHTLVRGVDLPAARAAATVAATVDGRAFIVGGDGPDGAPQATAWRFDTAVAPSGAVTEIASTAPARAGARALPLTTTSYLLTGEPAVLDVATSSVASITGAALPSDAATVIREGVAITIGVGDRVVRYRGVVADELTIPAALRIGHAVVATADDQLAVIGGELNGELTADVVKIDPITGAGEVIAGVLEIPRRRATVALVAGQVVVASGVGALGTILNSAEILDGTTLAHVATIPMLGRLGPAAEVLPNQQLLLVGGLDERGLPTDRLDLFTPELSLEP